MRLDPDIAPEPEKSKAPLETLLRALKNVGPALGNLLTPLRNLAPVLKTLQSPFKHVVPALKNLPFPKKLVIPAIAGVVLLTAGGIAFGLFHAKLKHVAAPQSKTAASASLGSTTKLSAACNGVVRDIYRQTVDEDPGVTRTEVRAEVLRSGVSCVPVPEIAAELKDLSPGCRDMVQYTYLGLHNSHAEIKVSDIREKVVLKSVACEHDRRPNIASIVRHRSK